MASARSSITSPGSPPKSSSFLVCFVSLRLCEIGTVTYRSKMLSVGVRTLWDEALPIELSESVLRMRLGRDGE